MFKYNYGLPITQKKTDPPDRTKKYPPRRHSVSQCNALLSICSQLICLQKWTLLTERLCTKVW